MAFTLRLPSDSGFHGYGAVLLWIPTPMPDSCIIRSCDEAGRLFHVAEGDSKDRPAFVLRALQDWFGRHAWALGGWMLSTRREPRPGRSPHDMG